MAAAQQLARVGHDVTVFEKETRIGGLLRYGIPDFKMEKSHIDRRVKQMEAEGVVFKTNTIVGEMPKGSKVTNLAKETVTPEELQKEFDAVLLTGGAERWVRDKDVAAAERAGGFMHRLERWNGRAVDDRPVRGHPGACSDEHHVVDRQGPIALAPVRQAGVIAEGDEAEPGAALPAQGAVLGVDEALDLGRQHALLQPVSRATLHLQGDGHGARQQGDLGR